MPHIFEQLFAIITSKQSDDPAQSYTAQLFAQGLPKIAQKLGEEATETIIAAVQGDPAQLKQESADLLYHLFVLWAASGITPEEVADVLKQRLGTGGLVEKAARDHKISPAQ